MINAANWYETYVHTHTHTHTCLMPLGELGLASCPNDSPSLFIPDLCILFRQTKTFYILFNTIPPCPSQTREGDGTGVEWKYVCNCNNLWLDVLPVANQCWKCSNIHWTSFFLPLHSIRTHCSHFNYYLVVIISGNGSSETSKRDLSECGNFD